MTCLDQPKKNQNINNLKDAKTTTGFKLCVAPQLHSTCRRRFWWHAAKLDVNLERKKWPAGTNFWRTRVLSQLLYSSWHVTRSMSAWRLHSTYYRTVNLYDTFVWRHAWYMYSSAVRRVLLYYKAPFPVLNSQLLHNCYCSTRHIGAWLHLPLLLIWCAMKLKCSLYWTLLAPTRVFLNTPLNGIRDRK